MVLTNSTELIGENDLLTILQKAPYGVILIGKDGQYLYVNPEFVNITGYNKEDISTGKDFLHKAYPDRAYRQDVIKYWKSDIARKGMERIFHTLCRDGVVKEVQFKPVLLDDGRILIALSDLTYIRKMEEESRQSAEKYRILFEDSRDAIFINTAEGKFIDFNQAYLDLFGYTNKEMEEVRVSDTYYNISDIDIFRQEIKEKSFVRDLELKLKKKDGTIMNCLLTATAISFSKSEFIGYQGVIRDITNIKRIMKTLEESEAIYRTIFETTGTATIIIEEDMIISMANHEFERLSGYTKAEIEGRKSWTEFTADEDLKKMKEYHAARRTGPGNVPDNYEFLFKDKKGSIKNVFLTVSMIPDTKKSIASLLDITDQRRIEENLRSALKTTHDIIESSPIGIYIMNNQGRIIYYNPALRRIGDATDEQLHEVNVLNLEGYRKVGLADKIRKGLQGEPFSVDNVKYISHFGKRPTVRNFVGVPFEEAGEKKLLMFIEDVTNQKFHEEELAYVATHDALTGLPNRLLFNDRLQLSLAYVQRRHLKLAVLMLDLDRFKEVNDTLGHNVGDMLLRSVADRLSRLLRKADTVARIGGDEFILLLPDILKAEDADVTADKIIKAFQKPFICDVHKLSVTTSIGIAVYPEAGINSEILVKNADIAMYNAKKSGRNMFQHYVESL
jgi:diguanylate cyclase (GGDEF)-like protein/PAS domain S-box-containing protein